MQSVALEMEINPNICGCNPQCHETFYKISPMVIRKNYGSMFRTMSRCPESEGSSNPNYSEDQIFQYEIGNWTSDDLKGEFKLMRSGEQDSTPTQLRNIMRNTS